MNIPIPQWLVNAWTAFCDWSNVSVFEPIAGLEIRRLDLLVALFFLCTIAWYTYYYGWRGALQSGVMFVIVAALALFVRRG